MKRIMLTLVLLMFIASPLPAEEISWITDFAQALQAAQSANKLIMVDFYTDWCGWCKRLDEDTYPHPDVLSLADDFINAKIHAEKDRATAKKYGVASYPTIVFLDSQGKEIWRVKGYKNGPQFAQEMLKAQVQTMSEELLKEQANLGDAEAAYYLAIKYSSLNDCNNATMYYDKSVDVDQKNERGYKDDSLLGAALCSFQNQNYDAALENYSMFLEEFSSHPRRDEALYFAGFVHMSLDQVDIANSLFEELLATYPKSVYSRQYKQIRSQLQRG